MLQNFKGQGIGKRKVEKFRMRLVLGVEVIGRENWADAVVDARNLVSSAGLAQGRISRPFVGACSFEAQGVGFRAAIAYAVQGDDCDFGGHTEALVDWDPAKSYEAKHVQNLGTGNWLRIEPDCHRERGGEDKLPRCHGFGVYVFRCHGLGRAGPLPAVRLAAG
jgi:hypothetical protein